MRSQKTLLAIFLVLILSHPALSHCIWAELPARAELNETVLIDLFFADPDDPIEKKDMAELRLVQISPDGQRQELSLEKKPSYQQTQTKLTQTGEYVFILERTPARHNLQEIRDFGKSLIWVGESGIFTHPPVGYALELHPLEMKELPQGLLELSIQVLYKGRPLSGGEFVIFRSLDPSGRIYKEIGRESLSSQGTAKLIIDPRYNTIIEVDHRVAARDFPGTPFLVTQVRLRSTLFIAAQ